VLPPVVLKREEPDESEDGDEGRDQQPRAHRPPLREHDQPAEERTDNRNAKPTARPAGSAPLRKPARSASGSRSHRKSTSFAPWSAFTLLGRPAARRRIDSIACSIRLTAPALPEWTVMTAGGRAPALGDLRLEPEQKLLAG
jgi:hypothetical protein